MEKKEAIEIVKQMVADGHVAQDVAEKYFPELKSEDERIRKALIKYFSKGREYLSLIPYNKEECVAWLEKQGDTNEIVNKKEIAPDILRGTAINLITWIDYNAAEGNTCLSNMECKRIEDALVNGDCGKIYTYMKKKLEKQEVIIIKDE